MNPWVDLHLHTSYSDGTNTPTEVVSRAVELGASAIAVTDHDTIAGVSEAERAAAQVGIEFLCGTEFSARYGDNEVHVLGLGIDINSAILVETLHELQASRMTRAERILERLADAGIQLDLCNLEVSPGGVAGRMHVARELVRQGHADRVQDAFDKYLNRGSLGYVSKKRLSCARAVEIIHETGGLAFIAHPCIGTTQHILKNLLTLAFDGIEAYHSKHTPGHTEQLIALARERGLLVTGGSDCHGNAKNKPEMGNVRTPKTYYDEIVRKLSAAP